MSPLEILDFHCHGGDVSRSQEIADYIRKENLSGLVLLSLPLAGYPGYSGGLPHLNAAVLENKRVLNRIFSSDEGLRSSDSGMVSSVCRQTSKVYAFGCLDNRSLIREGARPENRQSSTGLCSSPAAQVAALDEAGFDGLKLWEGKPQLAGGLDLMPDSPWIVEACREAGRRNMPVIFHVADPPVFWDSSAGELSLSALDVPDFDALIQAAGRLCAAASDTDIVFPHFLFLAGELERAALFLREAPRAMFDLAPGNYFYTELAGRPDETARFFDDFRDRILFGSDGFFFPAKKASGENSGTELPFPGDSLDGNRTRCRRLRKFLEGKSTEHVDNVYLLSRQHRPEVPCLALPENILEPVYSGNARRLLGNRPKKVAE